MQEGVGTFVADGLPDAPQIAGATPSDLVEPRLAIRLEWRAHRSPSFRATQARSSCQARARMFVCCPQN